MKTTIKTDHHASGGLLCFGDETGKLARRHLRLIEFHFEILDEAGSKQRAADALSLLSECGTDDEEIDDEITVLVIHQLSFEQKHQLTCLCQESDNATFNHGPHQIMTAKAENVDLPAITEFLPPRIKDTFCDKIKILVGRKNSSFTFDEILLTVR